MDGPSRAAAASSSAPAAAAVLWNFNSAPSNSRKLNIVPDGQDVRAAAQLPKKDKETKSRGGRRTEGLGNEIAQTVDEDDELRVCPRSRYPEAIRKKDRKAIRLLIATARQQGAFRRFLFE